MKLLFVVQAYGRELFGGAEKHCEMMATRLAARGHDVHVLTSCAVEYNKWENSYSPGTTELDGVTVHRLAVDAPRDVSRFGLLSGRILTGHKPVPLFLQDWWVEIQGPHMPELEPWLSENAAQYDVAIFFTYLYYHTARGLPVAAGLVPTVFHPLLHDEAPLYMDFFDTLLKLPTAVAYSVEEEMELGHSRGITRDVEAVVGIGTDLNRSGNGDSFRALYEIGETPYLVCVGRIDSHKGTQDLYDYFVAYKQRNPGSLKLVLVGEAILNLPAHEDVIVTGFVAESVRNDAVAGAVALVNPSYFESFSMTLIEGWTQSKPAIVNGRCDVLAGQARRSGGAFAYQGFAEFEAAVDLVLDPQLADSIGKAGRGYVEQNYQWDALLENYERFLHKAIAR